MKSPYIPATHLDIAWSTGYRAGQAMKDRDQGRYDAEVRWSAGWVAAADPADKVRLESARKVGYAAGNPAPPVETFL